MTVPPRTTPLTTTVADIVCRFRGHRPSCYNVRPRGTSVKCSCMRCRRRIAYIAPNESKAVLV